MLPAWQLRELTGDKVKMSDTLNSLGTLRQRQRQYAEAMISFVTPDTKNLPTYLPIFKSYHF